MEPYFKIVSFLKASEAPYQKIEHEPVYTSEQAAQVRGLSLKQGAKSLLFKAKDGFVLVVLLGDKRVDSKKIKKLLNTKDLRFSTPDEVKNVMGCEIGACYPFGNLIDVKMFTDRSLSQNEIISFNPGVHSKSIKIQWKDYQKAVNPELVDITE